MDCEHNQQEMTGQEIERGSLAHVLLFPSLRVPSAWLPRLLGYLLHRPSAQALLLHADRTRGFGPSGTQNGPQEHRQAAAADMLLQPASPGR